MGVLISSACGETVVTDHFHHLVYCEYVTENVTEKIGPDCLEEQRGFTSLRRRKCRNCNMITSK